MRYILLIALGFELFLGSTAMLVSAQIKVCMHDGVYFENVKQALNQSNVPFERCKTVDKNDEDSLYIIDDIANYNHNSLPQYYIVYQTQALTESIRSSTVFLSKLMRAVAVWDVSWNNINAYKRRVLNYYYFPLNYEFTDPVVLPCLLPLDALQKYKELLVVSNGIDGDISSHLPILFVYGILKQPKYIVECGVRSGESTRSFAKIANHMDAQLIGVDIDCAANAVYRRYDNVNAAFRFESVNARFFCMDDRKFPEYFRSEERYNGKQIDIIFIDTSHFYEHTLEEITLFLPLLSDHGLMIFHDSNVAPLKNNTTYWRINNTFGSANGQMWGVAQAIKEYFSFDFNELEYCNQTVSARGLSWHIIHYPYCNGLTIIEKLG